MKKKPMKKNKKIQKKAPQSSIGKWLHEQEQQEHHEAPKTASKEKKHKKK